MYAISRVVNFYNAGVVTRDHRIGFWDRSYKLHFGQQNLGQNLGQNFYLSITDKLSLINNR
jgi:hypothetical protein